MTSKAVEWILIIYYGPAAHKAVYGRLRGNKYTKDFIQLYKTPEFRRDLASAFPDLETGAASIPLTYRWPLGSAAGALVARSSDRPHLSWVTKTGAPPPWRMAATVSAAGPETILGDPGRSDELEADNELASLPLRETGQPYLLAVKLVGEASTLHLRAYLADARDDFSWASVALLPPTVRARAATTSRSKALAWMRPGSAKDSTPLFFDPDRNHDAWSLERASSNSKDASLGGEPFNINLDQDAVAESLPVSPALIKEFTQKIKNGSYTVEDHYTNAKTRGSAQAAFAKVVKRNYNWQCAITGISTREFLVAAHIVPWSQDREIRLDPTNGICVSVLVDRAFEMGYLVIDDDLAVTIDWQRIGDDRRLGEALKGADGRKLHVPKRGYPRIEYLKRRRELG